MPAINVFNFVFQAAEIEKQFFLCGGSANFNQRPAAQNIFLYRSAYPPHGIGGEAEAFFRVKFFHRLHQADIPL